MAIGRRGYRPRVCYPRVGFEARFFFLIALGYLLLGRPALFDQLAANASFSFSLSLAQCWSSNICQRPIPEAEWLKGTTGPAPQAWPRAQPRQPAAVPGSVTGNEAANAAKFAASRRGSAHPSPSVRPSVRPEAPLAAPRPSPPVCGVLLGAVTPPPERQRSIPVVIPASTAYLCCVVFCVRGSSISPQGRGRREMEPAPPGPRSRSLAPGSGGRAQGAAGEMLPGWSLRPADPTKRLQQFGPNRRAAALLLHARRRGWRAAGGCLRASFSSGGFTSACLGLGVMGSQKWVVWDACRAQVSRVVRVCAAFCAQTASYAIVFSPVF